jgi:hypothetical protein
MVELDAVWGCPRSVRINGKLQRVPFGVAVDSNFVGFITKWILHSGVSFTAKKVKLLKNWAIHLLAGEKEFSEPWFAKKHYKGYTIPSLGIFEYFVDNIHNLKVVKLVLIILNSYKLVMLGEPSLSSIKCDLSEKADHYIDKLRKYVHLPNVPSEILGRTECVDTRSKYADDFGGTTSGPYGWKDDNILFFMEENEDPYSLGRLVPIRDKGKWRNILVGHWAIQLKTKKLADWLRQWLWSRPEVASGNQSKMTDFCIQSLIQGRYMMSIDLSEATDRLSRDLQIKLLISMGVPNSYFKFLELPFHYHGKDYGEDDAIKKSYYTNGQPMGLFLSFPMFELAHYVILKFAVATSDGATFAICGDDVVVACEEKDSVVIFNRYKNLIERFGGVISPTKTIRSMRLAEGVGAIFLKGIPKEIRIPSGKVSYLEAMTPGTWLYQEIVHETPVGRALMNAWLSTKLFKEYTYQQRMSMNEFMVTSDLSDWSIEALKSLDKPDHMPQIYSRFDEDLYSFWRNTPEENQVSHYHFINLRAYRDNLVSNKIVSYYKKDNL